jgi:hypothetical protein
MTGSAWRDCCHCVAEQRGRTGAVRKGGAGRAKGAPRGEGGEERVRDLRGRRRPPVPGRSPTRVLAGDAQHFVPLATQGL